jgi:hypothetical protein
MMCSVTGKTIIIGTLSFNGTFVIVKIVAGFAAWFIVFRQDNRYFWGRVIVIVTDGAHVFF